MIILRTKLFGKFDKQLAENQGIRVTDFRKNRKGFQSFQGGFNDSGKVQDVINSNTWSNGKAVDTSLAQRNLKDRAARYKELKAQGFGKKAAYSGTMKTQAGIVEQNAKALQNNSDWRFHRDQDNRLKELKRQKRETLKSQSPNKVVPKSPVSAASNVPANSTTSTQKIQPQVQTNTPKSNTPKPNTPIPNGSRNMAPGVKGGFEKGLKTREFFKNHGGKVALGTAALGAAGYLAYRHNKNKKAALKDEQQ